MNILLTNDDGIHAKGLWELYKKFTAKHNTTVIAPDRERSAVSHGITVRNPLRANYIEINGYKGYSVNGTPADCVKLGILEILKDKPDIIISGINPGANVDININYSGTIAGAREGALYGFPSIAVSVESVESEIKYYEDMTIFIEYLASIVLDKGLPFGTFLNVNIPNIPINMVKGIKISRQGNKLVTKNFEKRTDPRNSHYYWLGINPDYVDEDIEIDVNAVSNNYISITPLKCDTTNYSMFEILKEWNIKC